MFDKIRKELNREKTDREKREIAARIAEREHEEWIRTRKNVEIFERFDIVSENKKVTRHSMHPSDYNDVVTAALHGVRKLKELFLNPERHTDKSDMADLFKCIIGREVYDIIASDFSREANEYTVRYREYDDMNRPLPGQLKLIP